LTYLPASASADLGLYLFTALLLVARVQAVRRLRQWQQRNVQMDGHLELLAISDSLLLSFAVLLIAFLLPTGRLLGPTNLAYEAMRTPLQGLEDDFNRLFAGLPARRPLPYRIWGDALAFQGTINPTTTRVLQVNSPVPMYWKARTYPTYTPEGWVSEGTVFKPLGWVPAYASPQQYQSRIQVSYSVLPKYATKSLFAGDQTIGADRPVQIETYDSPVYTLNLAEPASFRQLPPRLALAAEGLNRVARSGSSGAVSDRALAGSLPQEFRLVEVTRPQGRVQEVTLAEVLPDPPDVLSVRSGRGRIDAQQAYQLTSSVSHASPEELRRTGTDYPTWVRVRYTQLPDDLPRRVRDLATQLTAQAKTPYDKAKAIEGHLSTWHYTLKVEPPPYNADGVDHFLSTKAGYSEYFGSAMAVMLRSVGVPARLATGYATGDKVADKDIYLVTDSHSHAWVEVFFPGYGWIPFEPTPGKSLPAVPVPGSESLADISGDEGQRADECAEDLEDCEEFGLGATLNAGRGEELSRIQKLLRLLLWLLPALGLGLFLVGGGWLFWRRYMMLPPDPEVAFRRLALLGALSSAGALSHQTPFQYRARLEEVLPAHRNQVSDIVDSYVRTVYGRKTLTHEEQDRLASAWQALRLPLLMRILRRRNP
jgi:transglutaminase-like putative cysteine protease